jgi:hypothetical protein
MVMEDSDNATYYLKRAAQEERAAQTTANAQARVIHLGLAERYRVKARNCRAVNGIKLVHG